MQFWYVSLSVRRCVPSGSVPVRSAVLWSAMLLVLLACLVLPGGAGAAVDRIGTGTVTVSADQTYDNVYGDYTTGGSASAADGQVAVVGGTVHNQVYGNYALATNGTALAQDGAVTVSGGTPDGRFRNNIYGGYAMSSGGDVLAAGNSVLIQGSPSLNSEKYLYGGYAMSKGSQGQIAAQNNLVTMQTGIFENVYGGFAGDSSAFNGSLLAVGNRVLISGGTVTNNVYGGRADNSGSNVSVSRADNNTVVISGGSLNTVYGGFADSSINASASGNRVEMSGGDVQFLVGGDATSSTGQAVTDGNTILVSGGSVTGTVLGGSADNVDGSTASARANTLRIESATVGGTVSGGLAQSTLGGASAGSNSVFIGQGAVINGDVFGGNTTGGAGTASANTVTVSSGGSVSGALYGGQTESAGSAGRNVLLVTGGSVGGNVYGGATGEGGAADGNIVTVSSGGSVSGTLYGGQAASAGSASRNVLLVTNGTVGGDLYGGDGGTGGSATANSVIIGAAARLSPGATLYGGAAGTGSPVAASGSGNALFVDSWQGSVQRTAGFEYYHFVLPNPGADPTLPMLTLTGAQAGDFSGASATVQLPDLLTGGRASPGQSFTLIADNSGAVGDIAIGSGSLTLPQGFAALFDCQLTNRGQSLTFDILNFRANPQIKALNEARVAGMAALNQGSDLVAGEGMAQAARAATEHGEAPGWALFAAMYGGTARYHTGSYADVTGVSFMTGASRRLDTAAASATLGAFFEAGYAGLDTYNGFDGMPNVDGTGHSRYAGGGIMGRIELSRSPLQGLYAEASLRAGRLKTAWSSTDLIDNLDRGASFETSTPYYGAHAALGHKLNLTDTLRADIHARYFWTRQEGQTVTILGDTFDFDAVDSHRLRLGARLEYDLTPNVTPYIGAAWEREFSGTARSSVPYYGLDIASVSTRGNSGIFEAGLSLHAESIPLAFNAGLTGSTGAREGFGGQLNAIFRF